MLRKDTLVLTRVLGFLLESTLDVGESVIELEVGLALVIENLKGLALNSDDVGRIETPSEEC